MQQQATKLAPPLRVVLVDDHEVVRSGLRAGLGDRRIHVVAEAADVAGAVAAIRANQVDVVVLDVHLDGGGGWSVLQELGEDAPPTLAVSASDERDDVVRTVQAGATGYLLKTASMDQIVAAIRATASGEPVFSPELAGHLLELDMGDAVRDEEWESLTDREREVLRWLARGHPYKRIAEELVVSVKTVETHVRNTLRKLQVDNRHEATRWAIDRGFDAG